MNRSRFRVAAVAAAAVALGLAACGSPNTTTTNGQSSSSGTSSSTVGVPAGSGSASAAFPAPPADPIAAAAWEALMSPVGEYAASAAYQAVIVKFGAVEPYVSIQAAEERHVDALARQLQRMGVTVPPNPYAGQIAAPIDLEAAAKAWATGEVDNVAMYDLLLTQVSGDVALTRVLGNLRRASQEMHLPAFRAAAEHGGQLTQEQMTALGLS